MVRLLLIAVSLALDAMTVSVSVGVANPQGGLRQGLRLGSWFGAFQFIMPLLGFLLGRTLAGYVSAVSPYIAFALLAFIGGRMVWDALSREKDGGGCDCAKLTWRRLLPLAVATSIDALAVGVSAAFMDFPLLLSCCVIGAVAFALSVLGALVGKALGTLFQTCAQLAGGVILILMGGRFLLEHLV